MTRKCKKTTIRKEQQNLSSTGIHINKHWVTLYFILTGTYRSLLTGNSRYTPLEHRVTHGIFLSTRYAVCHVTPFFNPDICFSYCSPTCSQERWEKRSGQATNKQVGWFYIYISNRSTHRTKPAFGCRKGPQQLCEGAAACLPGLFLSGSQGESLQLKNPSQQSDMRACSHLRCSSAASPGGIRAKQQPAFTRLHYWSTRLLQ